MHGNCHLLNELLTQDTSQVFIMSKLTTWLRRLDSTAFGYLLGHVAQPDFGAAGQISGDVPGHIFSIGAYVPLLSAHFDFVETDLDPSVR